MNNKKFKKLDTKFKKLVKENKININSIEDLMIENIEDYKSKLKSHIEELMLGEIDEQTLISKKNKNGKKKDTN